MRHASNFYSKYQQYSHYVIDGVINNPPPDATMFSADCIQPEMYWKIENGKLMHTGTISTKTWFDSGYTSVEQAHKAGVREIFNLAQLQKIVEDKKCHIQ